MDIFGIKRWAAGASVGCALTGCAADPSAGTTVLALTGERPAAGLHWQVATPDGAQDLGAGAAEAVAPSPSTKGEARLQARARDGVDGAVTLQWRDTWYAAARLVADPPLDLRPYLADGTVDFDVDVHEMAGSGLTIAMGCGEDCERKINWAPSSRALQGRGWQHVSVPLRCLERDGTDFGAITRPLVIEAGGAQGSASVSGVRIVRGGRPNVGCIDYRLESVTPQPLAEWWALDWWMARHEDKLAEVRRRVAAGRQPQVVFIGDSITHQWETVGRAVWDEHYGPLDALDLGFSGDRTENVLWRLQHGEVDGLEPKLVVMMIGTNNTGHRQEDPQTTAAGVQRLVEELRRRLPGARVLLLAVFPREERPDARLRRINDGVNARIAGLQDGRHVFFLDIGAALVRPDGTVSRDVMPDLLHPGEQGYRLWADAMHPMLRKLLQD